MVYVIYSLTDGNPKIDILGCVKSLDVAQDTLKRKVRAFISYQEGEMKNQVACRPSLQELKENKDLKDGLYYICKSQIVEIYKRTSVPIPGWFTTDIHIDVKLVAHYMYIEASDSVLGVFVQQNNFEGMMRELKQKVDTKKEIGTIPKK